jgi:vitamin B12 transporter
MKKIVIIIAALLLASGALAEENADKPASGPVARLRQIVVTPSKFGEDINTSSVSISAVDTTDFDDRKIYMVKDALRDQVGLDIVQAGPFQGVTSLFTRGGGSNQTLIMIDGVKAYDPISPNGAYNLANLTLDNVDQIEIVRGPQSALYGTDAMSGVVNIMSKKAEKTYVAGQYEGGSFDTNMKHFEVGLVSHGLHYSIAGTRLDTRGLSQAQAKNNCQERDPLDRTSLATRVDYDFNSNCSIGATWRYTKAHYAIDQGAGTDDDNAFAIYNENFFSLYGNLRIFERWDQTVRFGWMEIVRNNFDDDLSGLITNDFDRSKYFGKNFKFDYQNTIEAAEWDKIVIGYDFTQEMGEYKSTNDFGGPMVFQVMPKCFAREGGLYLENRVNINDKFTSTQGMRVAHHSQAGTHETYRIDASYRFDTGTKIRGLIATGFKSPSLYQLNAPANAFFGGGNPNLKPEKSQSYEYGLDQYLFNDKFVGGITYFHTLYTNLIDALYNPLTWFTSAYVNVGKAQAHGIEVSGTVSPTDKLKIKGGYTYQKAWDYSYDQDLVRRPENKFFVETFWQATKRLSFDVTLRYVGPRSDNRSNPAFATNTFKDKEYAVLDGVINFEITKNLSVYAKMDNLMNKYYEDVRGYTTSPFAAYGGIKAKF